MGVGGGGRGPAVRFGAELARPSRSQMPMPEVGLIKCWPHCGREGSESSCYRWAQHMVISMKQ